MTLKVQLPDKSDLVELQISGANTNINARGVVKMLNPMVGLPSESYSELKLIVTNASSGATHDYVILDEELISVVISNWEAEGRKDPNVKFRFEFGTLDEHKE